MVVKPFEDLEVWKEARRLTQEIYRLTKAEKFWKDFALSGQIQRAVTSIMSNIAEGFERKNPRSFAQFLTYARGSCAELRAQLYLANDAGWLSPLEFARIMKLARDLGNLLGGLYRSQTACNSANQA